MRTTVYRDTCDGCGSARDVTTPDNMWPTPPDGWTWLGTSLEDGGRVACSPKCLAVVLTALADRIGPGGSLSMKIERGGQPPKTELTRHVEQMHEVYPRIYGPLAPEPKP